MGIVKRQGIRISIITYIGIGLGFINSYLLKTRFLGGDELGLVNLLPYLGTLFSYAASLGYPSILIKYFPYFQNKARHHHGILLLGLVITLVGILLVTGIYIGLKPWAIAHYEENARLLTQYYWAIWPLGVSLVWSLALEYYLQALLKAVIPTLIKDFLLRVGVAIILLGYGLDFISFDQFMYLFIGTYMLATLTVLGYTIYLRQIKLSFLRSSFRLRRLFPSMLVFAGYTYLMSISSWSYQLIDSLMLLTYVELDVVGIYTTMIFLISVIAIPSRSMSKSVIPIIARHWKDKALDRIQDLYQKAGTVNVVLGCAMLTPILAGADVILSEPLLDTRFLAGKWVLFILGVGRVFDLMTGVNPTILINSDKYRYNLYFMLASLAMAILTNYLLIPKLGINGAALATAITSITINSLQVGFIFYHFKLHPFNLRAGIATLIMMVAVGISFLMPRTSFWVFNLLLTSGVSALLYLGLVLGLKVSPDVNEYALQLLSKIVPQLRDGK